MSNSTVVRINLKSGEIEIQGTEEFVERQLANLDSLLVTISSSGNTTPFSPPQERRKRGEEQITDEASELPGTFGEWLNRFPRDLTDQDMALVAGRYVQNDSDSSEFKTSQVTSMLKGQGIKLANTSHSIKRLITKKLAFVTRKEGRISYYRLSKDGEERVMLLLEGAE